MAQGANQALVLVNESAYGVTQTTSPITIWVPLDGNNAFTPTPVRMTKDIRTADAYNRKVSRIAGRTSITGKLTAYAYADFGSLDTVPFVGRMIDWATTLTTNELQSYTARYFDGVRWRELLGGKVAKMHVSAAAESDEGLFKIDMDLIFQKYNATDPTPTLPALAAYARKPYILPESRGGIIAATSGTTARQVRGFDLTVSNILKPTWDDDYFIADCTYNGRDVDWLFPLRFTSKADRTAFEAQTVYSGSVVLTKVSPSHTLTLTFNGANFIGGIDRSFDLDSPTYETLHFANLLDTSVPSDFVYAVT